MSRKLPTNCARCKKRLFDGRRLCKACAVRTAREFGFDEYASDPINPVVEPTEEVPPPDEAVPSSPISILLGWLLLVGLVMAALYALSRQLP